MKLNELESVEPAKPRVTVIGPEDYKPLEKYDPKDWDLNKAWFRLNDYCNGLHKTIHTLESRIDELTRKLAEFQ